MSEDDAKPDVEEGTETESQEAPPVDDGPDEDVTRYKMPDKIRREMFAIADNLLGASKLTIMCEDGKSRMGRIRGKMKRRMWIKPGDLLIIKPWDFQDDKADVVYRYHRTQAQNMHRKGLIPELLDVF
ncbi:MAG: translation initiation factor eIF-1A [Thermoplasmatota archaeon]